MTITTAYGTSTVPERPKRVVTVTSNDTATVVALGVAPVAGPKYDDEHDQASYVTDQLDGKKIGATFDIADGLPYEKIGSYDPDLIVATDDYELEKNWKTLSSIAPVVALDTEDVGSATWQAKTRVAAKALGESEKGEQVIARVDKKIEDAAAAHPEFKGKTISYAVAHPDQLDFQNIPGDGSTKLFDALGFTSSKGAAAATRAKTAISQERLDLLDADVIVIGYPFGEQSRKPIESSSVFTALPAVKDGGYQVLPDEVPSALAFPDPLSQEWVVDQVVPIFTKAVGS